MELEEGPASKAGMPPRSRTVGHLDNLLAGLKADIVRKPFAWAYLVIALAWGIGLVVLMPPFQNNDEPEHYWRAWAIAEGQVLPSAESTIELPANVASLLGDLRSIEVTQGTVTYDPSSTWSHLSDPVSHDVVQQATMTGGYSVFGYIPQALGIEVARLVRGSPLLGLYLSRLAILVACVALTFIALRVTPFGAAILALVGLLPMAMTLATGPNPGALLDAATLLFLALILRAAVAKRVGRPDIIAFVAIAALFLTIKPGYAALALAIFLIPPRQFASRRLYLAVTFVCFAAAVAVSALMLLTEPQVSVETAIARGASPGVDSAGQLRFVIEHPWAFTKVLVSATSSSALPWAKEMIGLLGRGSVVLPDLVTLLALFAVLLVMMSSARELVPLEIWQRAVLLLLAGAIAIAVPLGLYVVWTPVASSQILGVQGRYFLPAAPCLLLGLYGWRLGKRAAVHIVTVAGLGMACIAMAAVLSHFY